jgi:pyrimidine operon attenuation protein/uracil phosphoribosyltransferase
MEKQVILNPKQFELTIKRLCYQIIENHSKFEETVLIGLQPRGIHVLERLKTELEKILGKSIYCGTLDITFYRDDFRRRETPIIPSATNIGRTIRSGIDALLAFGRPQKVELLTLIDRRFKRHLPIQADYIGKTIDSLNTERVNVEWKEIEGQDQVVLYQQESNG